jgi:hypothetical protein
MDNELTHFLMFFSVRCSPRNSCSKCPPQFAHSISVLIPSGSGTCFSALGKLPSKLGHPQPELNLFCDVKRGALHFLQIYVPSSKNCHTCHCKVPQLLCGLLHFLVLESGSYSSLSIDHGWR